ncbi:hypothetical protein SAMN05877809_104351 [Rhodobacter sp. JA431]|uniref:beta strand repeat-containing protein n=1 Tax=Rhodobacter sp. JA431 TaxID=570013 RepID=UPI000BC4BAA6|nr:Ig-like domain-containing protein [Rhodobacter sp. JA431]SOC08736.1 hypothetical protein SAMN05877809_104351 [Rhodobacter sp. JA431]
MVKSVNFAVRNSMGGVTRGVVAGDGASDFIQVGSGDEISLNLRKTNILKYTRDGDDLQITLVDGRTITLSGFFDANAQLYVSADGELTAVTLDDGGDGVIYAGYGRVEVIGKWSPNDQLAFLDGDDIIGPAVDDDTTGMAMFAPLAGLGAAGAAGAGLLGLGLINGGGGGGGGGSQTIIPTVDDPDAETTLTTNTVDPSATVSGTGEEGSTVEVVLGDQTQTTTIGPDGTWSVTFEDTTFPSDGDLEAVVYVTAPDGTPYELDGPGFLIDMTPPDVAITEGAVSTGDVENFAEYQDGVTIRGTGEIGATISVTIDSYEHTTTVDGNGEWEVTFLTSELPDGEYTKNMVVTATDPLGNVTTLNDAVQVDTEASVAFSGASVTADDVVNAAEATNGFTLTGTSEAGTKSVTVTLDGNSYAATVDANGDWTVTLSNVALGTGDRTATVTAVDAYDNVSTTVSKVITFDTEASVAFSSASVTADDVVNASEATNGFTLTGTSDAGTKSVTVTLDGNSYAATVDANGDWTITLSNVALGTGDRTVTVSAIDAYDNVSATVSKVISFDTEASVAFSSDLVTADDVVNATEAANGFLLSGTAEAGSTSVVVTLNGVDYPATVNSATGDWTVTVSGAGLGTGTHTATVVATDAYGNTSPIASKDIEFDVEASLAFDATQSGSDNLISGAERTASGGVQLTGTADKGATVTVSFANGTHTVTADAQTGAWVATFSSTEIPAGTYTATATATTNDGAGNTATASHAISVDTEASVAFSGLPVAIDDIVNGAEAAAGFTLSGTADPGSTSVVVTLNGQTYNAVVQPNGSWTATLNGVALSKGTYTATAVATDEYGNVSQPASRSVEFDPSTWARIDASQSGSDNLISGAERLSGGGVQLTGTAEAGDSVEVSFGTGKHVVTAGANGVWVAFFSTSEIPTGTGTYMATAVATDAAGNTATASHSISVDTEVVNLTHTTTTAGVDGVVNYVEGLNGLAVSGTVEAGSQVWVRLGSGAEYQATVTGTTWTANIPFSELPTVETSGTLSVRAVDYYGNTASQSSTVDFDPLVRNFTVSPLVTSDNIVNAQEAEDGFQITGTVEAGSRVIVSLIDPVTKGVIATEEATFSSSENWAATFDTAALTGTSGTVNYSVTAYDAAGNMTQTSGTDSFSYDLTPPDSPNVEAVTYRTSDNAVVGIGLDDTAETTYQLSAVAEDGTVSALAASSSDGYAYAFRSTPVPDGSYLVVTDHDTAGNTTSTLLLATNDASNTTTVTLDLSRDGLSDFDFGTIDLTAAKTDLTITDTQIEAITGAGNDLYVKGDSGDHVTLQDATDTHQNTVVDGHTYSLYTLGADGERLWVDDAITNLTI